MSKEKELISKGKHLAFLLRHDKEALESGKIDRNGWRKVSELCKEHGYSRELLREIVETNNKKRYEFDKTGDKIRARQGHSIEVDVELTEAQPPEFLYHGTSRSTYYNFIIKDGLKPMKRLHVHLSKDVETAVTVGKRHSKTDIVVLKVRTDDMFRDGFKFFLSNNGVWLTEKVPVEYISVEEF